jgi:predicted permease
MIVVPAVVVLIAVIAGDPGSAAWGASILQSAMPPMVTAGVVAIGAGLDEDLVVFMVGVGTLLSFVTVPLLSLLL